MLGQAEGAAALLNTPQVTSKLDDILQLGYTCVHCWQSTSAD